MSVELWSYPLSRAAYIAEKIVATTTLVVAQSVAALVLGVGAKKLGLLAAAGLFFAKFAKLIILGGVGALAAIGKLFGRKKQA